MGLKEEFKGAAYGAGVFEKEDGFTLTYKNFQYDFLARTLLATAQSGAGGVAINTIPFSQLDPETLEVMRDKLIELGGKPPELPAYIVSRRSQIKPG